MAKKKETAAQALEETAAQALEETAAQALEETAAQALEETAAQAPAPSRPYSVDEDGVLTVADGGDTKVKMLESVSLRGIIPLNIGLTAIIPKHIADSYEEKGFCEIL